MNAGQAIFLGIVQGITEFFPISSSGHLKFFEALMGLHQLDSLIFFDLVCHLGTLLAIFCVYFRDIISVFRSHLLFMLGLSLLPLFPLLLVLKPLKTLYAQQEFLFLFFLFSSLILFIASFYPHTKPLPQKSFKRAGHALFIGLFQALALIPGISRSGMTFAASRFLKWPCKEGLRYSFLLAIPTILGGAIVQLYSLWQSPSTFPSISLSIYLLGFSFSFVMGLLSLKLFIKIVTKGRLWIFSLYCLGMSFSCYTFLNLYH